MLVFEQRSVALIKELVPWFLKSVDYGVEINSRDALYIENSY